MRKRFLRFLSAVIAVVITTASFAFAKNVNAATADIYDGTVKDYKITETYNYGKYFEPHADGKYQVLIYVHGSGDYGGCGQGNMPKNLLNQMNRWIDLGYCDPMVVICPRVEQLKEKSWGINDFGEFVSLGYLDKLVEEIKAGNISDKVDTSKPIVIAGYSMGGSVALYAGVHDPDTFYNVGAISPSWCCYNGDAGYVKKASDLVFSQNSEGHFFMSYGKGEEDQFRKNVERYLEAIEGNGKNKKDLFKWSAYDSSYGSHGWNVFKMGTFEFLYSLKNDCQPTIEMIDTACYNKWTGLSGFVNVTGTAKTGNTLTAKAVSSPADNFNYQWLRDGEPISGATSETYVLTSSDVGKKVRCKATDKDGKYPGYIFSSPIVADNSSPVPTITTSPTITTKPSVTTAPPTGGASSGSGNVPTPGGSRGASSKEDISKFVDNIYTSVLGRDAEPEGAEFWFNELWNFKCSGDEVALGFINSKEFRDRNLSDEDYVKVLYKAFFDRDPDDSGMKFWLDSLSNGTLDRKAVANNFVYSQEWADTCATYGIRCGGSIKAKVNITPSDSTYAFVERMYVTALGRASDEGGKEFWANELSNYRCTGEELGVQFFLSKEMEDLNISDEEFVDRLYKTFMDRDAEPDGKTFWLKSLADGASRKSVVLGFTRSEEFVGRCITERILPY